MTISETLTLIASRPEPAMLLLVAGLAVIALAAIRKGGA